MSLRYMDPQLFAIRLKGVMKDQKLKQRDLAEASGLSLNTIKQYTSGRRVPGVKNLVLLTSSLGIDPDELIRGSGNVQ